MRLSDLLSRLSSRPSGRALEAPIRAIVHEVLKEQGFASPAEVAALRSEAAGLKSRLEALDARLNELVQAAEAARAEARAAREEAASAKLAAEPDPRVAALEARVAELIARPAAAPMGAAPLSAEPRGVCKVPGCEQTVRSKGFCSAHYQQWRRGTLKGFVGLDGAAEVDGRVVHLSPDLAGKPVALRGDTLLVDGQPVAAG